MLKSKSGQVGGTLSWIVATLIIIGFIIIFIYISLLMSQIKAILSINLDFSIGDSSETLTHKTSFSYQLTDNKDKEKIDTIILQEYEKKS